MTRHTTTPAADLIGGTIDYLRRCAANRVLEASLTPAQCRKIVRWRDIAERALLRLRIERAQCRQQSESAAALYADLQIERECTRVLRDAKIEQIGMRQHAERERDAALAERDELAARLAEIEAQEPVAWVPVHPRDGALWSMTTATPSEERLPSHYPLSPLYTSPAPAPAAAPELAEPADPRTPPPGCRLLGDYEPAQAGDMAYIGGIGGTWRPVRRRMGIIGATMDELSDGARVLALARPCRCGQDGCQDSVACPNGAKHG